MNQTQQRAAAQEKAVRERLLDAYHNGSWWGINMKVLDMMGSWVKYSYLFDTAEMYADSDGMSFNYELGGVYGGLVYTPNRWPCKCGATAAIWPDKVDVRDGDPEHDHLFETVEGAGFVKDDHLKPPMTGTWSSNT